MKSELRSKSFEVTGQVQYCAEGVIEIAGQKLKADYCSAFVEFRLSHSFPVVTSAGTCTHPSTVAKSYQTMMHKVFNVAHIMKAYDPEQNHRDRILGTVVAVEFPREPSGGWKVQGDKAKAPGIRAAAVIHKKAEWAEKIMGQHLSGRRPWTVSMENMFYLDDSAFLVKDTKLAEEFITPKDLLDLGYALIPFAAAPEKLRDCFNEKKCEVTGQWGRRDVLFMCGGVGGDSFYEGVGITPLGKEPEAEISLMLASGMGGAELEDEEYAKILSPARFISEEDITLPRLSIE